MGNLTKQQVSDLSKPGRYGDGNGLYLVIAPTGTKNWVQRIRVDGKRTDKGLGGLGKVSLGHARKIATANLAAIQQGRNPWAKGSTLLRRSTYAEHHPDVPAVGGTSPHPATVQV